jgi:hypothetical protein
LRLCGCQCRLVPSARAIHEGYLDKSLRRYKLKEEEVRIELRSRLLLYNKFFPDQERKQVMDILEESVGFWSQEGYPHANKQIKGDLLRSSFEWAQVESNRLIESTSTV